MKDVNQAPKPARRVRMITRTAQDEDKHGLFRTIAEGRFVLRRIFRIIEDEAKRWELDPTAHQALIQIYGSIDMRLRIKTLSDRLNVSPAFGSSLVNSLVEKKYVVRRSGTVDKREALLGITSAGIRALKKIDQNVKIHIGYFNLTLTPEQRESAVLLPMRYVKMSIVPGSLKLAESMSKAE